MVEYLSIFVLHSLLARQILIFAQLFFTALDIPLTAGFSTKIDHEFTEALFPTVRRAKVVRPLDGAELFPQ
jgi:hypothetical protein